jgi:hypothetical protein
VFNLTPDQRVVLQAYLDATRDGTDISVEQFVQDFLAAANKLGFVFISIRELNEKRNESYSAGWEVGFAVAKSNGALT